MQLAYRSTVVASVLIGHGAGIHRAGGDFPSTANRIHRVEGKRTAAAGPGQVLPMANGGYREAEPAYLSGGWPMLRSGASLLVQTREATL